MVHSRAGSRYGLNSLLPVNEEFEFSGFPYACALAIGVTGSNRPGAAHLGSAKVQKAHCQESASNAANDNGPQLDAHPLAAAHARCGTCEPRSSAPSQSHTPLGGKEADRMHAGTKHPRPQSSVIAPPASRSAWRSLLLDNDARARTLVWAQPGPLPLACPITRRDGL